MTEEGYGKQIGTALRAVEQMHSDCSKLLLDFDRRMEGWKPIHGNTATRDLTYHVRAQRWMAEGVYRLYSHESLPSTVRGLMICFLGPDTDQPVLLVAQIKYADHKSEIKAVCREWDMWQIYFEYGVDRTYDNIISLSSPDRDQRFESVALIATPLYSINSMEEVADLMNRVTGGSEPKSLARSARQS